MQEGLLDLEPTAQDEVRICARARASSFRRKETMEDHLQQAEQRVQQLKEMRAGDQTAPVSKRQQGARERQARERLERVKQGLQEIQKIEAKIAKNRESKRKNRPDRASTSDPESRSMRIPAGGFRTAFNSQLNMGMHDRIIVGVEPSEKAAQ